MNIALQAVDNYSKYCIKMAYAAESMPSISHDSHERRWQLIRGVIISPSNIQPVLRDVLNRTRIEIILMSLSEYV